MHSIKFEDLRLELLEEITDEGLKVLVAPIASTEEVYCGIHVATGSYRHEETIDKIKVPMGIAKLLERLLFVTPKGPAEDIFAKFGSLSSAKTGYSSTLYYFKNEAGSWSDSLDLLLTMVTNLSCQEEDISREKERLYAISKEKDHQEENTIFQEILLNLYFKSSIKEPIYGTEESLKTIHLSNIKKYFQEKYVINNLTLIIAGNVKAEEVHEFLVSRKLTTKRYQDSFEGTNNLEEYGKVVKPYTKIALKNNEKYLGFGLKFLPRMELFTRYGDDLFAIYEILEDAVFGKTSQFNSRITKLGLASLVETRLIEGGEDATLVATYRTDRPEALKKELELYLTILHKKVKKNDVKLLKRAYSGIGLANTSSAKKYFLALADAFDNHVAYPALIERASRLANKSLIRFLKDMETWCYTFVAMTDQ